MNIILVSGRLAKARTITLGLPQLVLLGLGVVALRAGRWRSALQLRDAALSPPSSTFPTCSTLLLSRAAASRTRKPQSYLRENLNAMAVKLGEMQAQLVRLDTLGERLAKLAGFKPQDLMFDEPPGARRRGIVAAAAGSLARRLHPPARRADAAGGDRSDKLGVLESLFTVDSAKKKLMPTMLPVEGGWYSSNFGWRIDPFTGQRAFHEGIDFMAEQGTPILAAAGGVVVFADFHPQYGNMIEIDHGNDLVTRYAHASKRLVKVGDVVLRGAKIAGSRQDGARDRNRTCTSRCASAGRRSIRRSSCDCPAESDARNCREGVGRFPTPFCLACGTTADLPSCTPDIGGRFAVIETAIRHSIDR